METKDFVQTWQSDAAWFSPGFGNSEYDARLYFWNYYQGTLLRELQKEINEGWKPITEVGPAAFKLRSYSKTESSVGAVDVLFWFLTFGLVFLIQLLAGSLTTKRLYYEPTEFRVALMK
jgi:hypothetical protein